MNRKIYKKIAKKNGVSVEVVKNEMQQTLEDIYETPTAMASAVPRKGEIPSIDELVDFCSKSVN